MQTVPTKTVTAKAVTAKAVTIPCIPKDKILLELPAPDPKDFLRATLDELPPPEVIAETILKYFWRRKNGYEDIEIVLPDGTRKTETRFVQSSIPLLSEVSRLFGLTKKELLNLARHFPDSIGRAVDAALDVADERMIHNTLSGEYHPSSAALVAPHASRIVSKQQVKVEAQQKISPLLDKIEQTKLPYGNDEA